MLKHGFPKPKFKGFMVENAQANWNVIRIVYNYGDPSFRMINKEHTCMFHRIQSFDRNTKQLIKPNLQDQHNALCHEYKNAKSLVEADGLYVTICCWWFLSRATFEAGVHELANWLNF
jgi:light-regulated signal transduction histidine kinase (bacteriophytochrome)